MVVVEAPIIGLGMAGNMVSFGVFSRKKFAKFNAQNMFRVSLLVDTIYLTVQIIELLPNRDDLLSNVFCSVYFTLLAVLPPYSSWILVFISAERFISIVYPTSRAANLFGKKWFEMTSLFLIFVVCFFYYCIAWLKNNKVYSVESNGSYVFYDTYVNDSFPVCYIEMSYYKILSYMNIGFDVLVPFILMVIQSVLIIYSMQVARLRILHSSSAHARKRIQRDFQFAQTILLLDFTFFLFKFPLGFYQMYLTIANRSADVSSQAALNILFYMYNVFPAVNFLVFLIFNRNFRQELFIIFNLHYFKYKI